MIPTILVSGQWAPTKNLILSYLSLIQLHFKQTLHLAISLPEASRSVK